MKPGNQPGFFFTGSRIIWSFTFDRYYLSCSQNPLGEEDNLLNENKKKIQDCALLLYPDRNPNPLKEFQCP